MSIPIAMIKRTVLAAAVVSLVFSLAGCAGQMAYRDGKWLVAEGKVEAGLLKLQEAVDAAPQDVRYRSTYLQERERALARLFAQAEQLANAGNREAAQKIYQRALVIEPGNDRARTGLRALDADSRHALWLKEAESALDKKDIESAKQKLVNIVAENPNHEAARSLQRSIAAKSEKPPVQNALSAAYKKPITIDFKDVPLKQIFEVISRTSGLNFLFDKEVKTDQRTSIFLRNSTIESAVHFMLMTNQLEQQILDGNTILIYPNNPAKLKDYQEMVVRSFYLTNAEAKTVANTLKTILKTRDIVIDEKLNMLIMRDSPEAVKLAEKLIALQDVAEPEVMLEVEILEIKRSRLQQLGIQWPASIGLTPMPLAGLPTTKDSVTAPLTLNDLRHQNSRTLSASVGSVTANANVLDGDANLLANPRIRARNREKAKILIGERVPNITTTATSSGFISESVNYVDVGLTLNVEPTVYLDNDVAIKVSLEVSNIIDLIKTQSGTTAYRIGTRNASTVRRLKNGETQVLAGLISDEERQSGNRIPGIGEMPVLGRLFGNATDDNQKTEIVLSITPRLIRNIVRPEIIDAEFRAGTDSTLRNRPDSGGATPFAAGSPASSVSNTPPAQSPSTFIAPASTPSAIPAANNNNTAAHNLPTLPNVPNIQNGSNMPNLPPGIPLGSNASAIDQNSVGISNVGNVGVGAAPNVGVQLRLQAAPSVRVGDIVTVKFNAHSDLPVTELPLSITFDSKILQVTGIEEGDFLKQGNVATSFAADTSQSGKVSILTKRNDGTGISALGTAATVSFRALAAVDATPITMLNGVPLGVGKRQIVMQPAAPIKLSVLP